MYNFNHLYYFYITAKLGSVTGAARHLHTSQSSLSTQIKALEANLGQPLFQKSGRKLELTQEGRMVFSYCQKAFEATEEMADRLRRLNLTAGPAVQVGVNEEIERPFTANLIGSLLDSWPDKIRPSVKLKSAPQSALIDQFSVNEIDYVLTTHPLHDTEAVTLVELVVPVVLLVAPAKIPKNLAREPVVPLLRRLDLGLALPSGEMQLRHQIDTFLQRNKITKNIAFESNIAASILRAATAGVGAAFLPLPYARTEIQRKKLQIVGGKPLWSQKFLLYGKKRLAHSLFATEFQRHIRALAPTFRL